MKIFSYILSFLFLLGIVTYLVILGIQGTNFSTISTNLDIRKLKSSDLLEYRELQEESSESEVSKEAFKVEEKEIKDEEIVEEEKVEDTTLDITAEEAPSSSSPVSDVLETQVGNLSGYGPDCYGCSGIVASGQNVLNGNIYYVDPTYGQIRILAGDYSYPLGTIVRVKNSKFNEFIGIVLDRGGDIGFGKSHLFDLLYATSKEALANEVSYQTTFEILRYGY